MYFFILKLFSFSILFCIILSTSCDVLNEKKKASYGIIFPAGTSDTIIYLEYDNLNIPLVMHVPACGARPLPAVIIMHGSGGMWLNDIAGGELSSQFRQWRDIFDKECVVSVFVDSYSPRGVVENEGEYKLPPKQFEISSQFVRPEDAYKAFEYISGIIDEANNNSLIRKSKVGLLGFSHGGTAVESAIFDNKMLPENWEWTQKYGSESYSVSSPYPKPNVVAFKAAVAYYPGSYHHGYFGNVCDSAQSCYVNYCPLLLHLAGHDPLTENSLCFANSTLAHGGVLDYKLYPSAEHSFDDKTDGGNILASQAAREATLEWFKFYLEL